MPDSGIPEACRARLETEIAKVEDDDRMQKVQDRHDHFAATKVSEGDRARVDDPRQQKSEEPKPQRDEGAGDDAPPATPSAARKNPIFCDIGNHSPGPRADAEMGDGETVWQDWPAGSSDRRVLAPARRTPTIDEEFIVADGPDTGGDRRVKTPSRRPPTKRRALTGDMFTHEDEPNTKRSTIDDGDDVDLGRLLIAQPGVGAEFPWKIGGQSEDQASASLAVGDPSAGLSRVVGGLDPAAIRAKEEDERILSRAILGQSLHEVYSSRRIELAVNRNAMERINQHMGSTDVCGIFSPERYAAVCKGAGLVPGESMDIKSGYNFDLFADRNKCWESIIRDEPLLVTGSPPCTMFSRIQELNKHMYRDDDVWMQKFQLGMEQAKRYIRCCIQVYEHQRKYGRFFLHESLVGSQLDPRRD